jgi:hypothetical protein
VVDHAAEVPAAAARADAQLVAARGLDGRVEGSPGRLEDRGQPPRVVRTDRSRWTTLTSSLAPGPGGRTPAARRALR